MALTTTQCEMIKAIADNDIRMAKKMAIASCIEDKTQKNKWFVERYKKILSNNIRDVIHSIPPKLMYKLSGELPEDFSESKYYLSDREKRLYEQIYKMKKVGKKLASMGIRYSNSTILYGPSGTGKTMFGKYVAYKLGLPFFYVNFSQMINSAMGQTASNISEAFNFIKTTPCVFMIDEIDCIAIKRNPKGSSNVDGEIERTTISIMQELDRLPNSVVLIAATNRIDLIDEAILSRFAVLHEIPVFDEDECLIMAKKYLADKEIVKAGIEFTDDELIEIIRAQRVQRKIINEITLRIGRQLFDSIDITEEDDNEEELNTGYKVRFTYEVNVTSDNMDEALEVAKREFAMRHYESTAEIERI